MVDGCLEEDDGRHVGIRGWEFKGEAKGHAGVGSFNGAGDGAGPVQEVGVGVGESGDAGSGGHHEGHEFGLQSVRSIC